MKKVICFLLIPMLLLFTPIQNVSAYSNTITLIYEPNSPSSTSTSTFGYSTMSSSNITIYVSRLTEGAYIILSFSNSTIPYQIINSVGTYHFNLNQYVHTGQQITMTLSLHTNNSLPGYACVSIT